MSIPDITPVGAQVEIDGRTYIVHPRVTSSACLRALRRLAESRNREASHEAMSEAERLLRENKITPEAYRAIVDHAAQKFTNRERIGYEHLGEWLQDVDGLAVIVSVCCDVSIDEAHSLIKGHTAQWIRAITDAMRQEVEAEKN